MTQHNQRNGMLTTSGVARLLNTHVNTVRRWSDHGLLKAYRIGPRGDRRFKREDIDSFLENNQKKPSLDKIALQVHNSRLGVIDG